MKENNIEFNEQFKKAIDLLENTDKNIFITGKAGTGKSTLLNYFRKTTKKQIVVLAPTGVAAINVNGVTIHSFFYFKPDITIQKVKKLSKKLSKIYKNLDAIVIDEISMVRADLLDCIDIFLRLNGPKKNLPFGGIQMIFIGDLYQLPPVVTSQEKGIFKSFYKSPYFFDAKVFGNIEMEFVELEKIYRQKDENFINILNAIRNNTITESQIKILNLRVNAKLKNKGLEIYLTTINKKAEQINFEYLKKLNSKIYEYKAVIEGKFDKSSFPTDENLKIAKNAQVMLLFNHPEGLWINGTMGKIIDIKPQKNDYDIIYVKLNNNFTIGIVPYTWQLFKYEYNEELDMIETNVIGKFIQYPLKLAWAITIHKSQGKTFDKCIIDLGSGTFAHGQTYVALSRCTSLDGISLKRPFKKSDIIMDFRVVKFITSFQYKLSENKLSLSKKVSIIEEAIRENKELEIVYLKNNDEKSRRIIKPLKVGEMTYLNKKFLGLSAFCKKRNEGRVFRIDRILEINPKY